MRNKNSKINIFNNVPDELFSSHILEFLNYKEIAKLRLLDKRMLELVNAFYQDKKHLRAPYIPSEFFSTNHLIATNTESEVNRNFVKVTLKHTFAYDDKDGIDESKNLILAAILKAYLKANDIKKLSHMRSVNKSIIVYYKGNILQNQLMIKPESNSISISYQFNVDLNLYFSTLIKESFKELGITYDGLIREYLHLLRSHKSTSIDSSSIALLINELSDAIANTALIRYFNNPKIQRSEKLKFLKTLNGKSFDELRINPKNWNEKTKQNAIQNLKMIKDNLHIPLAIYLASYVKIKPRLSLYIAMFENKGLNVLKSFENIKKSDELIKKRPVNFVVTTEKPWQTERPLHKLATVCFVISTVLALLFAPPLLVSDNEKSIGYDILITFGIISILSCICFGASIYKSKNEFRDYEAGIKEFDEGKFDKISSESASKNLDSNNNRSSTENTPLLAKRTTERTSKTIKRIADKKSDPNNNGSSTENTPLLIKRSVKRVEKSELKVKKHQRCANDSSSDEKPIQRKSRNQNIFTEHHDKRKKRKEMVVTRDPNDSNIIRIDLNL